MEVTEKNAIAELEELLAAECGSVEQVRATVKQGHALIAADLAKMLAAGQALRGSGDPEDLALLEELTEGSEEWQANVAASLLAEDGLALRAMLRSLMAFSLEN